MPTPDDLDPITGLTSEQLHEIELVYAKISGLKQDIEKLGRHRSYSTAITKLDEAQMWLWDRRTRTPGTGA